MFKSSVAKVVLVGVVGVLLVTLLRVVCFTTGDTHQVLPVRGVMQVGSPSRPASGPTALPDVAAELEGRVVSPEVITNDSPAAVVEVDLSYIPGAGTGELCRRLAVRIRAGETTETLALAAELIVRGDTAVAEVGGLLNSGNRAVETGAMRILVSMGTGRSLGTAISKILGEPYGDSRNNLLKVFGNARSVAVSGVVADVMMAEGQSDEGRKTCKEVLAAMEGGDVVEALAQRLDAAKEPGRQACCLEALSSLSKPSNVAGLEKLLSADDRPAVQSAVARALSNIGDGKACLILAQYAESNPVCRAALAEVRSPYAQKTLMEIVSGARSDDVKRAAQAALGHYDTTEIRNFLRAMERTTR